MNQSSTFVVVLRHDSDFWQALALSILIVVLIKVLFCLIGNVSAKEISRT